MRSCSEDGAISQVICSPFDQAFPTGCDARLLPDANCQDKGADCLVVALPCAFVDQGQQSRACVLRAKRKPPPAAGAGSFLIWRYKRVALGHQERLVDAADHPPVTSCRIFLQFDGDLFATANLD